MDESMENQVVNPTESEPILPEGWDGQSDLFADAGADDDKALEELFANATLDDDQAAVEESAPTTEPVETEDTAGNAQAEAEVVPSERSKLRFKAKYNHQEQDVELDESDLPTIYQKSLYADSLQEKLNKAQSAMGTAEWLAKVMQFENADAMLDAAAQNYRQSEIKRLVAEGTNEEIAAYYVDQRMGNRPQVVAKETPDVSEPEERNFKSEVAELLKAHPEIKGAGPLPQEVVDAAIKGGHRLLTAYEQYSVEHAKAEVQNLKKENQILRQNAASAARAPVTGLAGGGATDTKPADPFLEGFNSKYY